MKQIKSRETKNHQSITGISDEAVKAKTGKTWDQWLAILDNAGAISMIHKDIAAHLYKKWKVSPWWGQMITVGYERTRGLREKHETASGFTANISKVLPHSKKTLFSAWTNEPTRRRWLDRKNIVICKATMDKSITIGWDGGRSLVTVDFYTKGKGKTQLVIGHSKLHNAPAVGRMKTFWKDQIKRLSALLSH